MVTAVPATKIEITNEDQAFELLQSALHDELTDSNLDISFTTWPIISIKLEGKGYESTITPDIAESLVHLQQAMNRAYARAVHDTTNARSLTAEERRSIQFKAKVEKGSSLIKVDLGEYAEKLATALVGKMTSQEILIAVLGLALIGGTTLAFKAFLKHRSEDKKVDAATQQAVAMSQQETQRMQNLADAMNERPQLKYASQDFDDVRHDVLRSTGDAATVEVQDVKLTREEARIIALAPRSESEAVQLNGHYRIQKIDWQQPEQVRLSLFSTDTSIEFNATFKGTALDQKQKEKLKTAEWDRKPLYMQINGTRLRGEITTASIVSVEWPKLAEDGEGATPSASA
ncbi:hypothetical protein [Rhizobacter fulvus]